MTKKFWDQKLSDRILGSVEKPHKPEGSEGVRAINEEESRFLLHNAPDIILKFDSEGKIYFINRTVPGFTVNETIGKSIYEFIVPEHQKLTRDSIMQVFDGGCAVSFELCGVGPWGRQSYYSTRLIPIIQHGNIVALAQFSKDITVCKKLEQSLKEKEAELEDKNRTLKEMSSAFKVLLKSIDKEKKEIEDQVLLNIQRFVLPYLEKLKMTRMDKEQKSYLRLAESNLRLEIISPLPNRSIEENLKLTPTEIRISNLVKYGNTTKEIANLLNLSIKTIETHRKNIRKKLGIRNRKVNLRTRLLSPQ